MAAGLKIASNGIQNGWDVRQGFKAVACVIMSARETQCGAQPCLCLLPGRRVSPAAQTERGSGAWHEPCSALGTMCGHRGDARAGWAASELALYFSKWMSSSWKKHLNPVRSLLSAWFVPDGSRIGHKSTVSLVPILPGRENSVLFSWKSSCGTPGLLWLGLSLFYCLLF